MIFSAKGANCYEATRSQFYNDLGYHRGALCDHWRGVFYVDQTESPEDGDTALPFDVWRPFRERELGSECAEDGSTNYRQRARSLWTDR